MAAYLEQGEPYREATSTELTQVLEAHVMAEAELRESGLGYVQGMADVAAFLLLRQSPEKA
ncbi:MAG: hypothetical protein SGPRY_010596 [Prymnesium sp.]